MRRFKLTKEEIIEAKKRKVTKVEAAAAKRKKACEDQTTSSVLPSSPIERGIPDKDPTHVVDRTSTKAPDKDPTSVDDRTPAEAPAPKPRRFKTRTKNRVEVNLADNNNSASLPLRNTGAAPPPQADEGRHLEISTLGVRFAEDNAANSDDTSVEEMGPSDQSKFWSLYDNPYKVEEKALEIINTMEVREMSSWSCSKLQQSLLHYLVQAITIRVSLSCKAARHKEFKNSFEEKCTTFKMRFEAEELKAAMVDNATKEAAIMNAKLLRLLNLVKAQVLEATIECSFYVGILLICIC